jgi:hypothetical protein
MFMLKSQGGRAQRAVDGGSSSQEQLCTWRNDLHCSTGLTRESETAVPTKSAEFVRRFLLAIHHSSAKSFFAKAQLPLAVLLLYDTLMMSGFVSQGKEPF